MQARALTSDEAQTWRDLRIEGITLYPQSFLTKLDEAKATPLERIAETLERGNTFGVFEDAACCGIASLLPMQRTQCRHRAEIGAFFVQPQAQGRGAADALMAAMLKRAKELGCWQTELFVAEDNPRARRFYARHGFDQVGRLPHATHADGHSVHDLFMVRTRAPD